MMQRRCLKEGPGTPLVFLHGFLGTAADWELLCSYLPPCRCIGYDLPGHGDSPFVKTFELSESEPVHLIGYSMGGRLALSYASAHPEKIASLTLLSAHPGLQTEAEKQQKLANDTMWAGLLLELPIDEFLTRWYDQSIFKPYVPDLTMRKKQNVQALSASLLHYSLGLQRRFDYNNALILVGERDAKFRALYNNPIVIPNAGHMLHLENPKAVAQEMQKRLFL